MRQEIAEQPEALRRTFQALLPQVVELQAVARGTRQVLFIARGSSDNAAVYGQYLCSARGGHVASLASPSLATVYRADLDLRGVLAVAVSQSGATEEIVTTLDWARHGGARTVAVTNVAGSPLTEVADVALVTQAGSELAVPATKTYTTQLAAMAVLALALETNRPQAGRPGDNRPSGQALGGSRVGAEGRGGGWVGGQGRGEGRGGTGGGQGRGGVTGGGQRRGGDWVGAEGLGRVPDAVEAMLEVAPAAEALAGRLTYAQTLVVSGRGYAYSTALELSLKLKEACYVTAVGLSYADLVHGPIAIVDARTPALLVVAADGPMLPEMTGLAQRLGDTGAHVYGIGGDPDFAAACRAVLPGPSLPEHLAPFGLIVPGQLLAEALARAKGIDPDAPRGLRKVTQTDT
ncbi:MAG TPA: SIS domain-containing protein [Actinomycetes bacterium]|jgi:glucosamine--fructose-6-phosphate aminotransferase (isomerizing)|nr:SIS domain-containing protein [Actinomycetes bacterium]